jgi:CheY-like chemotaxis protein
MQMLNQEIILTRRVEAMNKSNLKSILIAEDNEESRIMLRTFLELHGYRVIEAEDGKEAVEVACAQLPDLILMDLNMPKLGGLAAAQEIRRCKNLSAVPILTNSSSGKHGMELFLNIEKLEGGYLEYIPKPFNFEYLLEMIETVLLKAERTA